MFLPYMTRELLSLLIQITCLALTVYYAACRPHKAKAIAVGIILMLFANVFGQMFIAGEGPAAGIGFIGLPLYGVIAAIVTVKIKLRKDKKTGEPI